jgi:dsRNA-specific ribonuclease
VLGIVTADYLYFHNAHVPEGELTRLRAMMVCEKTLHTFAQRIDLGDYLMLGHGEEHTNGRERPSILADAFEAVHRGDIYRRRHGGRAALRDRASRTASTARGQTARHSSTTKRRCRR